MQVKLLRAIQEIGAPGRRPAPVPVDVRPFGHPQGTLAG